MSLVLTDGEVSLHHYVFWPIVAGLLLFQFFLLIIYLKFFHYTMLNNEVLFFFFGGRDNRLPFSINNLIF